MQNIASIRGSKRPMLSIVKFSIINPALQEDCEKNLKKFLRIVLVMVVIIYEKSSGVLLDFFFSSCYTPNVAKPIKTRS